MHPEFKAYVEKVCQDAEQTRPVLVIRRPEVRTRRAAGKTGSLFGWIVAILEAFGPDYCEFCGRQRVIPRANRGISPRDAFGYHGLI